MPIDEIDGPKHEFLKNLVYGISHDMGAPVRHATSFSSLLMNQASDRLTEKEMQWLQFIHNGGLRAQAQIDALLSLSRIASQASEPQETTIKDVITHSLKNLSIINANATIVLPEGRDDNQPLTLIQSQWSRVTQELVSNALLFQPQNTEHRAEVHISSQINRNTLTLVVKDNGIGMSEKDKQNICKPFKQLNGDVYKGIGMGLTYVNFIAELHQGSLTFQDSELGGTTAIYSQQLE